MTGKLNKHINEQYLNKYH